jgi:hypothetical protein
MHKHTTDHLASVILWKCVSVCVINRSPDRHFPLPYLLKELTPQC